MADTGLILARAKEVSLEATIIRADGRREPLGRIAYWHRNPLRRLAAKVRAVYDRARAK